MRKKETAQQNDARRTILIQQLLSVVSPVAGVRPCIETNLRTSAQERPA
jgi:hypothetical protein